MRIVVSRIWGSDRDPFLIATHDIDLGDRETLTEINQINPTLENAIAHDIASGGNAVAEVIDANLDRRRRCPRCHATAPGRVARERSQRHQGARNPRNHRRICVRRGGISPSLQERRSSPVW